jgi:hypothetical protein
MVACRELVPDLCDMLSMLASFEELAHAADARA